MLRRSVEGTSDDTMHEQEADARKEMGRLLKYL